MTRTRSARRWLAALVCCLLAAGCKSTGSGPAGDVFVWNGSGRDILRIDAGGPDPEAAPLIDGPIPASSGKTLSLPSGRYALVVSFAPPSATLAHFELRHRCQMSCHDQVLKQELEIWRNDRNFLRIEPHEITRCLDQGVVSVENRAGRPIGSLVLRRRSGRGQEAVDLLEGRTPLAPAARVSRVVGHGTFACEAAFEDGQSAGGGDEVYVASRRETLHTLTAPLGCLLVENATTRRVARLHVRPLDAADWGEQVAAERGALDPGELRSLELPPGRFLIRAEYADGSAWLSPAPVEIVSSQDAECLLGEPD